MEFVLILTTFVVFWKSSSAVRCYKCEPDFLSTGVKTNLCQYFDGSEVYVTECLNSTMCYKKQVTMNVNNQVTEGIYRGCAPQTMRGDQRKINGKWHYVNEVYEVYEEKCSIDPNDIERPTTTTHCYCRGDLCNGAGKIAYSSLTVFIFALLWIS